jgi:hypothetical protein
MQSSLIEDAQLSCVTVTAYVNGLRENAEVPPTVLNVKNFPEELRRKARSVAVERGETLRDLIVRAVRAELERLGIEPPPDDDPDPAEVDGAVERPRKRRPAS